MPNTTPFKSSSPARQIAIPQHSATRPQRILVIANHAHDLIRFRGKLLQHMRASGLEVHAALPDAPVDVLHRLNDWGITYHEVQFTRAGLNPVRDAKVIFRLTNICVDTQVDSVLSYTIKPVLYGSIAARIAGVQNIYSVITGLGYAFAGDDFKRRLLRSLVINPLYKMALRVNTRVMFLNRDDMALFRSAGLVTRDIPAEVINGEGIDLNHFRPCAQPDTTSFLLIARLLADKGIREYVSAARMLKQQYPMCSFRLVGWIDDSNPASISRRELRQWMAEGIIEYLGKLEDVRPAIADSSVYVLPSYREGMPVSILEAMAMGRPVITTDAPGCRDTVTHGINGFLVPVGACDELAEAMRQFIRDPSLCVTMGKESLRRARARYDVKKVNNDILSAMAIEQKQESVEVA